MLVSIYFVCVRDAYLIWLSVGIYFTQHGLFQLFFNQVVDMSNYE